MQLIRWHDAPGPAGSAPTSPFWLRTPAEGAVFSGCWPSSGRITSPKNREVSDRTAELDRLEAAARDFLAGNPPLSPKDLAVTGRDLMPLGFFPGRNWGPPSAG